MSNTKTRTINTLRVVMPIVGILCMILFLPWDGVIAWISPTPKTVQEQVDRAISHGLDGIVVYVDEAGKKPAFYSAGWKNREHNIPADPQSLFKIASIGKLFVAAATTQLVGEQRLSLDDSLAKHFPELANRIENSEKITLKQMLQHRSGIPNWADNPNYPWGNPPQTSQGVLEYALDQPAVFEPNQGYGYSNTNYFLLAKLIDKVVGYSHLQYFEENILTPLKLNNTYGSLNDVDINDVMSGYYVGWEPDLKNTHYGSMISTAEDVGIFLRALNDGSLLNETEQAIYSSVYVYEHTGLLPGYYSIARYHKDIDTVVIQFTNTTGGAPLVHLADVGGGTRIMVANIIYDRIIQILRRNKD